MDRRKLLKLAVIAPLGLIKLPALESRPEYQDVLEGDDEGHASWNRMLDAIKPHVKAATFEEYFLTVKHDGMFPDPEHLYLELTSASHAYIFANAFREVIQKARRETNTVPITATYYGEDGSLDYHFCVYFSDPREGYPELILSGGPR